jgi:predicted RecA/RadA family phage recombinase
MAGNTAGLLLRFIRNDLMINKIKSGATVTIPAFGSDVAVGAVVLAGSILGIAVNAIKSGDDLVLNTIGEFESLPKATGETWSYGDALYWSSANGNFTKTSASNKLAGNAVAAAASGDIVGSVRIGYHVVA